MIRKFLLFIFIFPAFSLSVHAQKSKVVAVFHLIESEKYEDAKKAIEEAIKEENTSKWYRTWYTRGYLAQTAYEKGLKNNNKKKYQLYPDQLHVAFESYEKARKLNKRERFEDQLAPLYVLLANDFQKLGENLFSEKRFEEALKAFEKAMQINRSPVISVEMNPNLIYNAGLAAYLSKDWEKATDYFTRLNKENHSPNIPHLLSTIHLENADTISAKNVLLEGIDLYENNEELVLILADLFYKTADIEKAVDLLDSASLISPLNYIFPYTKGLIYQKTEHYDKAIEAYEEALTLAPNELKIYTNIGNCYYNIGVEIDMKARAITNNRIYKKEKERSADAFKSALSAFEKAHEKNPENRKIISKLNQLYEVLDISNKIEMED